MQQFHVQFVISFSNCGTDELLNLLLLLFYFLVILFLSKFITCLHIRTSQTVKGISEGVLSKISQLRLIFSFKIKIINLNYRGEIYNNYYFHINPHKTYRNTCEQHKLHSYCYDRRSKVRNNQNLLEKF